MVTLTLTISAVAAIVAGLLVLIWPKSLNFAVGLWLLIHGIAQLIS